MTLIFPRMTNSQDDDPIKDDVGAKDGSQG